MCCSGPKNAQIHEQHSAASQDRAHALGAHAGGRYVAGVEFVVKAGPSADKAFAAFLPLVVVSSGSAPRMQPMELPKNSDPPAQTSSQRQGAGRGLGFPSHSAVKPVPFLEGMHYPEFVMLSGIALPLPPQLADGVHTAVLPGGRYPVDDSAAAAALDGYLAQLDIRPAAAAAATAGGAGAAAGAGAAGSGSREWNTLPALQVWVCVVGWVSGCRPAEPLAGDLACQDDSP